MKYRKKLPVTLDVVMSDLLQITQGIFLWNREQFFHPLGTADRTSNPFHRRQWSHKYMVKPAEDGILLRADPVDTATFSRTRLHTTDKCLLIRPGALVLRKGMMLVIRQGKRVDILKFVRTLSVAQRASIYNPNDLQQREQRERIVRLIRTAKMRNSPMKDIQSEQYCTLCGGVCGNSNHSQNQHED